MTNVDIDARNAGLALDAQKTNAAQWNRMQELDSAISSDFLSQMNVSFTEMAKIKGDTEKTRLEMEGDIARSKAMIDMIEAQDNADGGGLGEDKVGLVEGQKVQAFNYEGFGNITKVTANGKYLVEFADGETQLLDPDDLRPAAVDIKDVYNLVHMSDLSPTAIDSDVYREFYKTKDQPYAMDDTGVDCSDGVCSVLGEGNKTSADLLDKMSGTIILS